LDFFLWGFLSYLKKKVYAKESEDVEEMIARLHAVAMTDTEMLHHVRNETGEPTLA